MWTGRGPVRGLLRAAQHGGVAATTMKGEGMGQDKETLGEAEETRLAEGAWEWVRSQPGYRPGMKQMTATHADDDVAVAAIVARRMAGPYRGSQ